MCELSVAPDIPPEKRNAAFHALRCASTFYAEIFQCAQSSLDLKVANDVRAKMCCMENSLEDQTFKVSLSMPKDCELRVCVCLCVCVCVHVPLCLSVCLLWRALFRPLLSHCLGKLLSKWLSENTDLKDRLLVLQQVLNTLATIHTLGYVNDLSLCGSFMGE